MAEKKAKVPICPRCGYGMGIWRTQKLCKACLEVEGNSSAEASLAVVKQKLASKPAPTVRKPKKPAPKTKASPSGARTRNRTPKATRP